MTTDELWVLYHLEKFYFENGIDQYQPAPVLPDYWEEAFESLWQADAEQKTAGTLLDEEVV